MKTSFLILSIVLGIQALHGQDARDIVRKADELMHGMNTYSEMAMTIVKPEWSRSIAMKIWSIEPDYALVYITEPARDRGTVTLKRKVEVWNWIPSVQRAIKIPPSMMLQSWMGSDFTNDDLVRKASIVDDYTHTMAGTDVLEGRTCWKIALVPKPSAGVVWGKLVMWIAQKGYMELRIEYYDEDGVLVKTFTGTQVKSFDGRTFAAHWEMVPVNEPGKKTVLEYRNVIFDMKTTPSFFSEQNMKQVR